MKERTIVILQALVEDFIESASPVASKKLLEAKGFKISSATVRNEFATLEEVGLIQSPHVSAGKVPTSKGYRFFVDQMMAESDQTHYKTVQSVFDKYAQEYKLQKSKESLLDALRITAQLSENVAFTSVNDDQTFYLGLSNVLRSPEFVSEPEKAAQIVEILEGRQRFQAFLNQLEANDREVKIFIGEENILDEISSCAVLVAPFQTQNMNGFLGILGPMRMNYGFNKALIENVLELVT